MLFAANLLMASSEKIWIKLREKTTNNTMNPG